jgi:MFS transporter, PPP family, 3-phenylpropionic acid transporter
VSASTRLSLFYAAYFLGAGVQLPFWPVWLAGRGLSGAEIGLLMALTQWARVAASPALGVASDRVADRRRFMLLLAGAAIAGYAFCLPAHGFAALIVPALVVTTALATQVALADAATLAETQRGAADYGKVRLWGTIAFIAGTLAGGRILSGRPSGLVLYMLLGAATLTFAATAALPRVAASRAAALRGGWLDLATPRNALVVLAATFIQSSHAVYYVFGTLYWERLGYGDGTIAWLWAEGAIAEVLLFRTGARWVGRLGPVPLMMLGGAGGILRWSLTAFVTSLPALVLVQPLHALTFAAAHLGAMHYIARAVPEHRAGTAQTLYATITGGIGLGLASALAGALYATWGGATYFVMAAMAGAGALLAWRAAPQRQAL